MRTRYGDYPEYHSSEDDLVSVVTPTGLQGGLDAVKECLQVLETEPVLTTTTFGEPQLGKRGLYHTMLNKNTSDEVMLRTNVLAYADGTNSIYDLSKLLDTEEVSIREIAEVLEEHGLILRMNQNSRPFN
jgi:aminopeptidase-like protein